MKLPRIDPSTQTRILTALALLLPVVILIGLGGMFVLVLAWAVYVLINYEFYSSVHPALEERKYQFLLLSAVLPLSYHVYGFSAISAALLLSVVVLSILFVLETERSVHEIDYATAFPAAMLGLCYPGLLGTVFIVIVDTVSPGWIFWLLGTVICSDTFAYFGGRAIGGAKFAPRLSPKKTISGAICGMIAGVVFSFLFALGIGLESGSEVLFLGLLVTVLALIGDLVESLVKRSYGIKDMGTLLPGHGGVFDRVDALVFATPALFFVHLV